MKKLIKATVSGVTVILIILNLCTVSFAENTAPTAEIKAKSAVLMDVSTGKVLMEFNPDTKLFPASVTKIMTILLVAEAISNKKITLADKVACSLNAASKGGSQIWLEEGEEMTVDELLRATAVASANDASVALAEFVAGSEEALPRNAGTWPAPSSAFL